MSGNLFIDGSDDVYNGVDLRVGGEAAPKEAAAAEGIGRQTSVADPEDLTPIGQQRNDLGSLFSIDDFNPFYVNNDHFENSINVDGGDVDGETRKIIIIRECHCTQPRSLNSTKDTELNQVH